MDRELLVGFIFERFDLKFEVGGVEGESFGGIEGRDNFVIGFDFGFELGGDIALFFFVFGSFRFLDRHQHPQLIAILMDVILDDRGSFYSLAS